MNVATLASAPHLKTILLGAIEIHNPIIVSGSRHSLLEVFQWTEEHVIIIIMDPKARGEKISTCLGHNGGAVWLTE